MPAGVGWRDERRVALVDAERVELRELARQVGAVAVHVAPPGGALHAGQREDVADPVGGVRLGGGLGHLEVQHWRQAIFHAPDPDAWLTGGVPSHRGRRPIAVDVDPGFLGVASLDRAAQRWPAAHEPQG